jgi:hypothetical protein
MYLPFLSGLLEHQAADVYAGGLGHGHRHRAHLHLPILASPGNTFYRDSLRRICIGQRHSLPSAPTFCFWHQKTKPMASALGLASPSSSGISR